MRRFSKHSGVSGWTPSRSVWLRILIGVGFSLLLHAAMAPVRDARSYSEIAVVMVIGAAIIAFFFGFWPTITFGLVRRGTDRQGAVACRREHVEVF